MPTPPALRVGLLIDSFTQPQWVYKTVKDIRDSGCADIVLVIENDAVPVSHGAWRTLFDKRHHVIRKIYIALDQLAFTSKVDPFTPVDIRPLMASSAHLRVLPRQTRFSDYFSPEDVSTILGYQLDVAFRFGFRLLKGDALTIAKYGVWSYHHGDNLVNRGGPAGFWEVMEHEPVTGSVLQILTARLDDGHVLYRSWASTVWFSVKRNKDNYYWKSSAFAARALRDLAERGPAALNRDSGSHVYRPFSHRLRRAPGNREMLSLLAALALRMARRGLHRLWYREQWFIGFDMNDSRQMSASFHNVKPLMPPKDRFWADPWPVAKDGKYYIFIEEWLYRASKGHVAVIEMEKNGQWTPPVKVLEKPYHLSHPCIFTWQESYYMIPETLDNRAIELYRCVSFPCEWTFDRVLMSDVLAVDATVAEIDGMWWLFANIAEEGASTNDELHVFCAQRARSDRGGRIRGIGSSPTYDRHALRAPCFTGTDRSTGRPRIHRSRTVTPFRSTESSD